MTRQPPILGVDDVSVSYGAIRALRGVSMHLDAGEIRALLGGNGAGKSTLIKCLTGVVQPDAGEVLVDGRPAHFARPSHALAMGVRVVYQELSLFPTLSVTENVLGPESLGWWVNWRKAETAAAEALTALGIGLHPRARVGDLSVGEQQIVEIVRAVRSGGRVLILDEPTSALGPQQAAVLFELVHSLADAGMAVLFVTQDFGDALKHADSIQVMREGQLSDVRTPAETSTTELIHLSFGTDHSILEETYESGLVRLPAAALREPVLQVAALSSQPQVDEMSLTGRAGEVVGIFGGLGAGHLALAEVLFGARRRDGGTVEVSGRAVPANNPAAAVRAGIGYVPADRREALALDHRIADNITLAHLGRMAHWLVPQNRERQTARDLIGALRIRSGTPGAAVQSLSGGNQQKVLFARWMLASPKVLLLVEPTRGMDIGAKSDVVRIIRERADAGTAVVVISTEPEIILSVADRVLIARKGRIVREFADEEVSMHQLMEAAA